MVKLILKKVNFLKSHKDKSLRDILYFISKYARIKYKMFCELLFFYFILIFICNNFDLKEKF